MNTETNFSANHVIRFRRSRYNPLTGLTDPTIMARKLDSFEAGYLREAAVIWDALEQRDDVIRAVVAKRKKAVARHGFTVLPKPDLSESEKTAAREHVAALEYFYNYLQCEHGLDNAEKGGFKLLVRQMMDAVGKRFAVHEITWNVAPRSERLPGDRRSFVSAKFRFVPLSFFENTTGQLRFLDHEAATEGQPLAPGSWMVTAGDGLMTATSAAWVYKNISLTDWLLYSERNGRPVVRGVTSAAAGSTEWDALENIVADVIEGSSVVHSASDDLKVLDLAVGGNIPFPALVDRMDRMIAALWRGADLSTISRDRGYGASLQEKETCVLEEDDAEMLTETLQRQVDTWVIRYVFGEGVKPLAGVKILVSPKECTADDLKVDEFLVQHGAPLSLEETMVRYGRRRADAGEPLFGNEQRSTLPLKRRPLGAANIGTTPGLVAARGLAIPLTVDRAANPTLPPIEVFEGKTDSNDPALANRFTVLQPDWVEISPYGDFPHARGLQRIDRAAAEGMVARFNSFRGRLGRLFGGVPFYIGHPDLPGASELADHKAYGWVDELEAREAGLYGRVKWSEAGEEIIRQGHFKYLSPYWEAREIGREKGEVVYAPTSLVSVGLTNQPNIPVKPLANDRSHADDAEPTGTIERAGESRAGLDSPPGEDCNVTPMLREITVEHALSNALSEGRITPAQEDQWRVRLSNDFAGTIEDLQKRPLEMHTVPITAGLGLRKHEVVRLHNRRDRMHDYIAARMRDGLTYDQAWERAKRERPEWFNR